MSPRELDHRMRVLRRREVALIIAQSLAFAFFWLLMITACFIFGG